MLGTIKNVKCFLGGCGMLCYCILFVDCYAQPEMMNSFGDFIATIGNIVWILFVTTCFFTAAFYEGKIL